MRRTVAALGVTCAVTLTGAPPAQAITGNSAPDFDHPYVGLIVLFDAGGAPFQSCSGSLLTDTVFLTAGHCLVIDAQGTTAASARVWFEQDAGAGYDPATAAPASSGFPASGGVPAGTVLAYGPPAAAPPQPNDVGLVILDQPVTDVYPDLTEYASLAAAGTLEDYAAADPTGATVTISGYGASNPPGNPQQLEAGWSRLSADTDISGLNTAQTGPSNVQLAGRQEGTGGGACFGDSGGPLLLPGTDVAAAVVSSGSADCAGAFLSYRTDSEPVLAWVLQNAGSEAVEIEVADVAVAS